MHGIVKVRWVIKVAMIWDINIMVPPLEIRIKDLSNSKILFLASEIRVRNGCKTLFITCNKGMLHHGCIKPYVSNMLNDFSRKPVKSISTVIATINDSYKQQSIIAFFNVKTSHIVSCYCYWWLFFIIISIIF